jgi:hypothetical protein
MRFSTRRGTIVKLVGDVLGSGGLSKIFPAAAITDLRSIGSGKFVVLV